MKPCFPHSMTLVAISCLLACRDESPTQPRTNLAGPYVLNATESCGLGYRNWPAFVVQTGDRISFVLSVDTDGAEGTIHGDTIAITWSKGYLGSCRPQLTGTATIGRRTIKGSVSASVQPNNSCFYGCTSDTIVFTLVRKEIDR